MEKEILSVRDVVRAIKRCDSDTQLMRVLGTALAMVKDVRLAKVKITVAQGRSLDWGGENL
jgi:hypothetical protein